jgi:uncharacterized delta-60 repeat protein
MALDAADNIIVTGYMTRAASNSVYATIKYSSAGQPLWTNYYSAPGSSNAVAYGVAVDSNNDVVVTGYSGNNEISHEDYLTIKYSSAGLPLWTNSYNGPGSSLDIAKAVAVDGSNNVIVTGYSYSANADYATIKYSSLGIPLWTNRYNGPAKRSDFARGLAIDHSDNILVTGYSLTSSSGEEFATIKYSSDGTPLWTNRYSRPGVVSLGPIALAVDRSNNVAVTGYSSRSGSDFDYSTVEYSSTGQPLWTNLYADATYSNNWVRAIVVDGSNNVIVTGSSGAAGIPSDFLTIKYSSAGVPLWTNRYSGPSGNNNGAAAIALDSSGNPIVTGSSVSSNKPIPLVTVKYLSMGAPLWTIRYDGPTGSRNSATASAVDHTGALIVSGQSTGLAGDSAYAIVKYGFPLVITDCRLESGVPTVVVENLQTGSVMIAISTNFTQWVPVFTNAAPGNALIFSDLKASDTSRRFYRAAQLQ